MGSGYRKWKLFQLCQGNQFPLRYKAKTAKYIGTKKGGTALVVGAIPPHLKYYPVYSLSV